MPNDPRRILEQLCLARGEDFAGLSRMLGRNPAYIQQFIRRGVPRRLKEDERGKLARYFGINEESLGGPPVAESGTGLVAVARSPVRASAGPGAHAQDRPSRPYFGFDATWLKALTATPAERLSIVRVEGDSMAPTLSPGDDILVDPSDGTHQIGDGIYVLRIDDQLVVKRLALHPRGRMVTIQSDNPAYPDWPDCPRDEIVCVGKVIWAGRRVV